MRFNVLYSVLFVAGSLCLAGCGGQDRAATYPVSGSLFVDGRPAAGARLIFHPAQATPAVIPTARVKDDGSYQATSYDSFDGAPPGEYRVTVTWPAPKPAGAAIDEPDGPDRLKGRYAKVNGSPWKITVKAETNELQPIRIRLEGDSSTQSS